MKENPGPGCVIRRIIWDDLQGLNCIRGDLQGRWFWCDKVTMCPKVCLNDHATNGVFGDGPPLVWPVSCEMFMQEFFLRNILDLSIICMLCNIKHLF